MRENSQRKNRPLEGTSTKSVPEIVVVGKRFERLKGNTRQIYSLHPLATWISHQQLGRTLNLFSMLPRLFCIFSDKIVQMTDAASEFYLTSQDICVQHGPVFSREVFEKYDILLVDVFGVLWSGVEWIDGAMDTLEYLMRCNKIVIILSNASVPSEYMLKKCSPGGPISQKHFSKIVTSGEVLVHALRDHQLSFKSVPQPERYTIWGTKVLHNFEGSSYKYTDSLDEADFVYVSIPQFTNDQKSLLPNELQQMLCRSNTSSSSEVVWDSLTLDPFIPQLEKIFKKKKPLLVANPDKHVSVGVLSPENDGKYVKKLVIRQGALGEAYSKMGGEVLFIGKPYPKIYEFALNLAAEMEGITFPDLKNKKIAMIGDTLETDILGAKNASQKFNLNIDGILVDTGISYRELSEKSVEARREVYRSREIVPAHEVGSIALDSEVLF